MKKTIMVSNIIVMFVADNGTDNGVCGKSRWCK